MRETNDTVWIRQQAEMEFVWKLGSEYPTQIIATVYETNLYGEKWLIEQKILTLDWEQAP